MDKAQITFAPVSVVIPCYCCHETIERACLSVLNQTLIPSQIILVEDASDDDGKTSEKIKFLSRRIESAWSIACTTIFLEQNEGPGEARNRGWEVAKNDFIAFLDADDAWHPSKIEIQLSWMRANPKIQLTCHRSVIIDKYYNDILMNPEPIELKFSGMLYRNKILTRTVMLKKALPNRFQKGLRFSEDYRLWLDILADNKPAILLNIDLASSYRDEYSGGGQSSKLWEMECSELNIYWDLYCHKLLRSPVLVCCLLFSLVKFFIRCLNSYMIPKNVRFIHRL
jgi:glycosyltransferase involved in cell wall biosynthesis